MKMTMDPKRESKAGTRSEPMEMNGQKEEEKKALFFVIGGKGNCEEERRFIRIRCRFQG
jgi:hypothetical protein